MLVVVLGISALITAWYALIAALFSQFTVFGSPPPITLGDIGLITVLVMAAGCKVWLAVAIRRGRRWAYTGSLVTACLGLVALSVQYLVLFIPGLALSLDQITQLELLLGGLTGGSLGIVMWPAVLVLLSRPSTRSFFRGRTAPSE